MLMRFLISFTLMLSMAACSFKKPSAQSPEEKAAEQVLQQIEQQKFNGQLSEENVRVEFQEASRPGSYFLVVTWPKDVPAMKVSVDNKSYEIVNDRNSYKYAVMYNEKHSVHLVALNSIGGEISSHAIETHSPNDLLVNKEIKLLENVVYKVNRVYFQEEGRFLTNTRNLRIEANKIYVTTEGTPSKRQMDLRTAHIVTSHPDQIASSFDELKGSTVEIIAKKAYGQLRIGMIGINGKDGAPGANAVANDSLNGAPGRPADVRQEVDSCMSADGTPCFSDLKFFCISPPTNGTDGKKGFTGGPGQNGWNGGNSGSLSVVLEDSSEFQLEVALRRGLPGKGGAGGLGSPGGLGGPADENTFDKCRSAQNGAPGPQGDQGAAGVEGQPGLIHQPITNFSNAVIYEIR